MHRAEPAVALTEHAPRLGLADERAPDDFGVAHDAVGAKMHQVIGLRARVAAPRERLRQHDRAPSVAARIEQQYVVVIDRALHPARVGERPRSRKSRAALEKDQPWLLRIRLIAALDRPRENGKRFALWLLVVERHGEFVVDELHAVMADAGERAEGRRHGFSLARVERAEWNRCGRKGARSTAAGRPAMRSATMRAVAAA